MKYSQGLQDVLLYDTLISDSVQSFIMNKKLEQIKKLHPYKVTPPTESSNRWQTSYMDTKTGKRKNIKASSEQSLWNKLYAFYSSNMYLENLTFNALFLEWIDYKTPLTSSPNTIKRYEQHYKRYLLNSCLDKCKLIQIDDLLLERECNRIVRDFNLSRKEWTNVKTILNGMFNYSLRKKYLSVNPMEQLQIQVKFRQVIKKTGRTETFNSDEIATLNSYLDEYYDMTKDTSFLAVRLNLLLGLRIGELVALRWEDMIDENHIHIVREEIRDQTTGQYVIVEHTKTHTDRFVVLVPKAKEILSKMPRKSDYLFVRDGKRLTARQIAYVLEKYAIRNHLIIKSTHKMRKTYASNLSANGVPIDCIRELLGHSNLTTTMGYIYNPLTETETYNLITKAL